MILKIIFNNKKKLCNEYEDFFDIQGKRHKATSQEYHFVYSEG
jgi:hypothetical protein